MAVTSHERPHETALSSDPSGFVTEPSRSYTPIPYARLGGKTVSNTRSCIRDCISQKPGIHFNEIKRELDIATGQTQYHLRKLIRADQLEKESIEGRTHYYPPTFSAWERGAIALLRRETTREIVLFLLRNDATQPDKLASQLDIARSTVEWHLSRLSEHDVIEKKPIEKASQRVVVTLQDEDSVYRLLREIEPHILDRVVDRFSRLTDNLLDG
jgi:DNA-binding MarR family transcriptional regulator